MSVVCDKKKISLSLSIAQVAFLLCSISGAACAKDWSNTNPQVNLTHIFEGEINAKGRPTGFHARPHGRDPENAQLSRLLSRANAHGIYTGVAEIYDHKEERWKRKSFSSFFPDQLSKVQVVDLILKAYKNAKVNAKGKWSGASGAGFRIDGWLCPKGGRPTCPDGAINTAYPVYVKE